MASREVWETEISHHGLNKYRQIRGTDRHIVRQKAEAQLRQWDEMWEKKQAVEEKKAEREAAIRSREEKTELAKQKSEEANSAISLLENTLAYTLEVDDTIDWDSLLDKSPFAEEKPRKPKTKSLPREPRKSDDEYQPNLGLLAKLLAGVREKKLAVAEREFLAAHDKWEQERLSIEQHNIVSAEQHVRELEVWEERKKKFETRHEEANIKTLEKKRLYEKKEANAISDYCEMVLSNSEYPEYFPQEWDLEYQPDGKILIIDYSLPDIDRIPTVTDIKYVATRDEFKETQLSAAALNRLYDGLLYQLALRTIHELYEADTANGVESIVFNGWVDAVNKSTGHNVNSSIMSVQASKDEFQAISLDKVDPKACFKQLKGVGSSKLHGLSPVAPIIHIDKEDRRFVSAYDVVGGVDESSNLAAMDWQDFENLIRELFEKEFVTSGGEVKITQASRDGGVDAIAFDPDPLRGGKIVIQAKRYTNVVSVSAVRDLYGTVLNEGATKGILVTTADYGPDAYEFAKGKPLTLLNGSNLLHMLEKHGHKARIDLKEAKKILAEQDP